MTNAQRTPVEVDTDLAAAHNAHSEAERRLHFTRVVLTRVCEEARGIRARHTRRGYIPQVSDEEAVAYAESQRGAYRLGSYTGSPEQFLNEWAERTAAVAAALDAIDALNAQYRGWSRFFLVTSSAGHVHSSMHCSTCRITTSYGWLPELSGLTEADAVAKLGSVLCSVCFPTAPVAYVGGRITKARAIEMAA